MIKGIIFDLDGVLVSTDEMHYLAWKRLADELQITGLRERTIEDRGSQPDGIAGDRAGKSGSSVYRGRKSRAGGAEEQLLSGTAGAYG